MLIDSNILIYALNSASPKSKIAQNFLRKNSQGLVLAQQNILETIRVLTHSKFPNPFPPKKALSALQAISDAATVISPNNKTLAIVVELIDKYEISGSEIFDAYLVATALSHQYYQVATDNIKHLQKYQEIEILNPFS
jgi:predicted nucleic acid-binding protein